MTNNSNKTIKQKKILGFSTFDYTEQKIKSDIETYWDELYWKKNRYLNRYENIYKNT